MKLGQNVCLDEILEENEMGHVGSKTRSLGQILEKSCVCFKGQIFFFYTYETWSDCWS